MTWERSAWVVGGALTMMVPKQTCTASIGFIITAVPHCPHEFTIYSYYNYKVSRTVIVNYETHLWIEKMYQLHSLV